MQWLKFSARACYKILIIFLFFIGCKPKLIVYKSPPHYDFSQQNFNKLDIRVKEISGLIWDSHNNQFIAHNDEKPFIFFLDRDTKAVLGEPYRFAEKNGDYEDIAMIGRNIYILKSDGTLFRVVTDSTGNHSSSDLGKLEIGGTNDFETLYYDQEKKALIMLCKNCSSDQKKVVSAFAYYPDSIGFDSKPIYSIDVSKIDSLSPRNTSRFQPSAARIHPVLKKLFILSSASNQLVIANTEGNVESVFMLAKKMFPQPEGLTFRSNGDMYISNEAVSTKATIFRFAYIP